MSRLRVQIPPPPPTKEVMMSPEQFIYVAAMWSALILMALLFTVSIGIVLYLLFVLVKDFLPDKKHNRGIR